MSVSATSTQKSSFTQDMQSFYPINHEAFAAVIGGAASGIFVSQILKPKHLSVDDLCHRRSPAGLFSANLKAGNTYRAAGRCGMNTLVTPIAEEVLFRGYLYPLKTQKSTQSKVEEIGKNVALFTIMHFDPRSSFKQTCRALPRISAAGLIFTTMAEKTGDLWMSTGSHVVCNGLGFYKISKSIK